jgi:hypothetical protein
MIEGAIYEGETFQEEDEDVAILRLAGPVSVLLSEDFGIRAVEEEPRMRCRPPVSLHVCRESRMHTLSQYRQLEHSVTTQGSFYFNPYRDVLWLSQDFTDRPEYFGDLERCYGEQLNAIETLLVEESEWNIHTPALYTSWHLGNFGGLKVILLLFEEADNDTDGDDEEVEDTEYNEDAHGCGKGQAEGGDPRSDTETRQFHARADRLRAGYAELLEHRDGLAKKFQCVDRNLTLY